MGMVALVVVGNDVSNADQILEARMPGKGMDRTEALSEKARATVTRQRTRLIKTANLNCVQRERVGASGPLQFPASKRIHLNPFRYAGAGATD
jgi:hypothetical protein